MIMVRIMEDVKPPIKTQASPFFHSEPAPVAMAMGTMAITIAMVVIKIGRNLCIVPSTMAWYGFMPSLFNWLAKSTINIAFLTTSPISMVIPNIEKILIFDMDNANANKAPMMATATENITTNG